MTSTDPTSTDPTWTDALGNAQAQRIATIVSAATAADGTAPISEQALHSLCGDSTATHLTYSVGDLIAGYANLVAAHGDHPAMAEAVVDPAYRRRGIGAELVAAALAEGGPTARAWAHGDLAGARGVATRLGLASARELLQMRRSLTSPELPELVAPEGISLRTYAGEADDADLLRVNNSAFAWHPEQSGWTEREIAVRRTEDWFDARGLFMAIDDATGVLLGFHWTKVHTETEPAVGEVYVVAIDPAAQGRGLGRILTLAGLHYLRDRGLPTVLLYTEADNVAAVHTYQRLAFDRFHVDVAYTRQVHSAFT